MKGPTSLRAQPITEKLDEPLTDLKTQLATQYQPTAPQVQYVLLLASGLPAEKARRKLKITLKKVRAWCLSEGYRCWKDSIIAAESTRHVGEARAALRNLVKEGDLGAIKAYLEGYDPEYKAHLAKGPQVQHNNYHAHLHNVTPTSTTK